MFFNGQTYKPRRPGVVKSQEPYQSGPKHFPVAALWRGAALNFLSRVHRVVS